MDCCIDLRCLLAFLIVLNKTNFSRPLLRFPSAILSGDIPLGGWLIMSFEFGATVARLSRDCRANAELSFH